MAEPQAFDPSKPFSVVEATPPGSWHGMVDPRAQPKDARNNPMGDDPFVVHAFDEKTEKKLTTGLFHPTGIEAIDNLTSPVNLALTAVLGARSAAKALGAAAEAVTAGVDTEIVSKTLKFLTPSKYREGLDLLKTLAQKATASAPPGQAAPTAASSAPAAPASPVASSPVAPAPPVAVQSPLTEPAPPPTAQSSTVAPPQSAPTQAATGLPDQKALNEAALAVRRAAYQARLANTAAPEPAMSPAPTKPTLSVAETKAFMDLMQRGMPSAEAMKNVLMQRELVASLRIPTPTAAQTRFPKGMRGKS